jgi:methanethiol S-methyltransferase
MRRAGFLLYSLVSYFVFFGVFLYAMGFIGNIGLTNSIDGNPQMPVVPALLINGSLLLLFVLQQASMASPAFKRWRTKFIPQPIDRSTSVLVTSLCLLLLMWQWQPIGGVVWKITNESVKTILFIIYLAGWIIVFITSFLVNHFDLLGLRQSWLNFRKKPSERLPLPLALFYRFVRNPLYMGLLICLWSASTMTVVHLSCAMLASLYMMTVIQLEEKGININYREKYTRVRSQ